IRQTSNVLCLQRPPSWTDAIPPRAQIFQANKPFERSRIYELRSIPSLQIQNLSIHRRQAYPHQLSHRVTLRSLTLQNVTLTTIGSRIGNTVDVMKLPPGLDPERP